MAYAEVKKPAEGSRVSSEYWYDAYGRRTISREAGQEGMRTVVCVNRLDETASEKNEKNQRKKVS
jgi:hypothetical protein